MKRDLKDVKWKNYPMKLENEEYLLKRKGFRFRLLYDVTLKKTGEFLGTCVVMEDARVKISCNCEGKCTSCKCAKNRIFVEEYNSTTQKLTKNLERIQKFVRESM